MEKYEKPRMEVVELDGALNTTFCLSGVGTSVGSCNTNVGMGYGSSGCGATCNR